jgi:hypothetical protein
MENLINICKLRYNTFHRQSLHKKSPLEFLVFTVQYLGSIRSNGLERCVDGNLAPENLFSNFTATQKPKKSRCHNFSQFNWTTNHFNNMATLVPSVTPRQQNAPSTSCKNSCECCTLRGITTSIYSSYISSMLVKTSSNPGALTDVATIISSKYSNVSVTMGDG